jgi:hypothetical protein
MAQKSNIKHHDNGVITYTIDSSTWMISTGFTFDRGWGNGYICIPEDHKFIEKAKKHYKDQIIRQLDNMVGLQPIRVSDELYDVIPQPAGQEWTFGEHETIEDETVGATFDVKYYVFGFDTNHMWNNKENSDEVQVCKWIEDYVNIVNA